MVTASTYGTSRWNNSSFMERCVHLSPCSAVEGRKDSLNLALSFKWAAASVCIYPPAMAFAKLAILVFYLRINPDRGFRLQVFAIMFIITGYSIAVILANIFECKPISKFWNPLLPGKCIKISDIYLSTGILNVVTDFLVLAVPMPMLVRLQ